MKRNHVLTDILFADAAALPLLVLVFKALGYKVLIQNSGAVYAVTSTVIFCVCAVLLLLAPEKHLDRLHTGLLLAALPLCQINALVFLFKAKTGMFVVLPAHWIIPVILVTQAYGAKLGWKAAAYVLSGFMELPIVLFLTISFYSVPPVTLASAVSPDGTYCAVARSNDQGALGGDTVLDVYRVAGSFDVGSCSFRKDYRRLYWNDWRASAELEWIDNDCIEFSGMRFSVSQDAP